MTMLLSNGAGNYDGVDDAGDDVGVVTVAYDDVDVDYYDKNGDSVGDWDDGDGYGTADGDDGYVDYDNDDTCADTDVATCGYIYAYGVAGVGNVTTVDGDADDTQYDEDAEEGDGADVDADNGEYDTEDVGVDTVVAYDGGDDAVDDAGEYADGDDADCGDWDDGDGYGTADGDDGYVDYDNDDTCADTDVATCGYIYAYGVAGVGNVTTVDGDADDTQYDEDAEEGDGADVDADNGEYDTEDVGVDTVVAYDGGDDAVDDAGEYADGDDADCGVGYVVDGGDDSCDDGDYDEPDTNSGVVVVDDIAVYVDNGTCTDNCVMMVMPMLTMVILLAIRVMMLCMWW